MQTPITIVGAGPAGCAAALTLRRYLPDLPVALVTRSGHAGDGAPAVGETLSPGVLPLLAYLGLREEFLAQAHLPCGGTASAWGSDKLLERSYLFTGRGNGWHLDRSAFDAWLLACAKRAGVVCIQSRVITAIRIEQQWSIELEQGNVLRTASIVEASGRSSWLLRQHDARCQRNDGLVAEAHWFNHDGTEPATEGALVESTIDGWWYSASLPSRRGVAMFMTDHDLRPQSSWERRLAAAPATCARLALWQPTGETAIRAAHSQRAERAVGDGWVAAGDSAAAFDPISALGIGFSLRSGMQAARVAVAALHNEIAPADEYASSVTRIYDDYRARLRGIYEQERRWTDSPFWARRQTAQAA
jgi:flavin-dependent dehydrogenase